MSKDEAKAVITKLVEKYESAKASNLISKYTEEETKKDFILPLFKALNWDVDDKNEVTAEEHQSSGRVDYGFYLNSRLKFYLEAKSLGADLHKEEFANQAIKYSWNKGATWAILTDFESIKIFNAQDIERSLGDKLFFEIPYAQYLERFDQLWLLSKDSFEENLLDKEAEKVGKKFQKIAVTTLLYKDLDNCRQILTDKLSQWNDNLDKDLLDEGVQKLLDRLIFLRVAEDRKIEPPTLIPLIRDWENNGRKGRLYESMIQKFRELDLIYNSGLFSEHPFESWDEYSNTTEKVINILYGKKGYYEYDFKAMPADVLGTVYENYLGYRLNKSKKGISIGKDATKRKEHGIYYTPSFIVDYIVENTLKPVLDKCTSISDLKKIKVLDPACGSGSFLIKALEIIYNKYLEFGNNGGVFTKLDILLNNIYGVDLDPQAVEIARLNLLINALDQRMKLPSLDKNIKNGNSLISGTDEELTKYFGKDFRDKKPFNWEEEFPDVFKQGGFDVIIGNPPYISAIQDNDLTVREFYRTKYSLNGAFDIYVAFLIMGIRLGNKNSTYGWIIPNKLMVADYAKDTMKFLLDNGLYTIIDISSLKVFGPVGVYPIIALGDKTKKGFQEYEVKSVENLKGVKTKTQNNFSQYKTFKELGIKISSGATGFQAKSLVNHIGENQDEGTIPFVVSGSIDPYNVSFNNVRYMGHNYKFAFIKNGSDIAESKWNFWEKHKIVVSGMTKRIEAYYSTKSLALGVGIYGIYDYAGFNPYFLLAILNSSFLTCYFREKFKHKHLAGGYLAINKSTIEQLPIIKPNKTEEYLLVNLAKKMMELMNLFNNSIKDSDQWKSIKSEIEKTDKKIDEEVYEIYGLSEEEIKIVEESTK